MQKSTEWMMNFFISCFIELLSVAIVLFMGRLLENFIRTFKVKDIKEKRVLITGCDSGRSKFLYSFFLTF